MAAPLSFDQIITLANEKHGSRYDYSLIPPNVKRSDVVMIVCPEHGEYTCKMATHLAGHGKCPQCNSIKHEARTQARFKHKNYYIDRAVAIHGTLYDYSQLEEYPSFASKRATIICKEHGPFNQLLSHHITNGAGCPKCGDVQRAKNTQKGADFFLNKVRDNTKYDYSLVPKDAKSSDVVPIVCPDHGTFNQLLSDHSNGRGCPKCAIEHRKKQRECAQRVCLPEWGKLSDRDWLITAHHIEQRTLEEMSYMIGCSDGTVGRKMKELGVEVRRYPKSAGEREIADSLTNLLGADDVIQNSRNVIAPRELDIYIPSRNLAIEFCGLYWHSEKFKDRAYHLDKLLACEHKGIRLITIFDDEWRCKPEIVIGKLKVVLGLGDTHRIPARRCEVVRLNRTQKRDFFDKHHIQGSGPGSVTYGLQHNGSIIAAMTFIKQQGGRWDLNRYATAVNVPGGFTKLLTHFKRQHQWAEVVSFADRRWSVGDLYATNGFTLDCVIAPDYSYTDGRSRRHKFNFRHKHLPKILGDQYNPNETELQNMERSKYLRIWNCGLLRYVMTNPDIQSNNG